MLTGWVRKETGVIGGNREEQSGAMAFDDLKDAGRPGGTGQQDTGPAYGQREIKSVSQPVSKE